MESEEMDGTLTEQEREVAFRDLSQLAKTIAFMTACRGDLSEDDRESVGMVAFVRAVHSYDRTRGKSLRNWVIFAVRNAIICEGEKEFRRKKREKKAFFKRIPPGCKDAIEQAVEAESDATWFSAIRLLSDRQKRVIYNQYVRGLGLGKIADIERCSIRSVVYRKQDTIAFLTLVAKGSRLRERRSFFPSGGKTMERANFSCQLEKIISRVAGADVLKALGKPAVDAIAEAILREYIVIPESPENDDPED